jgi:hypothetical protein
MNYSKMTTDDFNRILYTLIKEETLQSIINIPGVSEIVSRHFNNDILLNEETEETFQSVINIPGIYEILSKRFNNDILEVWEYEQYIKVKEIVEKISLWNPEMQRTIVLFNLLNELTEVLYGVLDIKMDKYVNLRAFPVREFYKDVVDKYSAYPIWTCDFEGSCLVGAEKFEIERIDAIIYRFEGE